MNHLPDCYGRWHSTRADECKICTLYARCALATARNLINQMDDPILDLRPVRVADASAKVEGGFKVGTMSWTFYRSVMTIKEPFTLAAVVNEAIVICKLNNVKQGNMLRIGKRTLERMRRWGVICFSHGEWKRVARQN